jgi:CheY-like chemotaxis protein
MSTEHPPEGSPPPDRSSSRPKQLRILVVEDHADTAASLAELLRLYGHEIRVAGNGAEALCQVESSPPDVVLLDIGLPGMDGWEVARRLRLSPGGRMPLLMAITGYGQEADRERSRRAGSHLHLLKPVDSVESQQLLRRFQATLAG